MVHGKGCAPLRARQKSCPLAPALTRLVVMLAMGVISDALAMPVMHGGGARASVRARPGSTDSAASLKVAIAATIYMVDPSAPVDHQLCGIVKWCADASHLATQQPPLIARELVGTSAVVNSPRWAIDVVLSTNARAATLRAECPQSNVMVETLSAALMTTVRNFTANAFDRRQARRSYRQQHGGSDKGFKLDDADQVEKDTAWLSKWAMVGLTRYALILHLDLDIDLVLPGRGWPGGAREHLRHTARIWAEVLPRFIGSGARMLASIDGSAPVNMGSVWLRPSAALFAEGVDVLTRCQFSLERGFDKAGTPGELLAKSLLRIRSPLTNRTMAESEAVRSASWNFVAASSDQGLFSFVFAMRAGAAPLLLLASRADSVALHFWGRLRPWREGHPSCPAYYEALGMLAPSDANANAGHEVGDRGVAADVGTGERLPTPARQQQTRKWRLVVATGMPPRPEYARSTCWPRLVAQAVILAPLVNAVHGHATSQKTRMLFDDCRAHKQLIL